ncbi:MAG: hypothetical protein WBP81_29715, partial [Solirubrobacteraceae bacterium]
TPESPPDEQESRLSEAVVEGGERLSALIEKLLDLFRLQAGRAGPGRGGSGSRSRRCCSPLETSCMI